MNPVQSYNTGIILFSYSVSRTWLNNGLDIVSLFRTQKEMGNVRLSGAFLLLKSFTFKKEMKSNTNKRTVERREE